MLAEFISTLQSWCDTMGVDLSRVIDVITYHPTQPLLFNTSLFMLLFAGFMCVYRMVDRFRVIKMILVILFSLYFYYKSSGYCVLILLGVCVCDYLLGIWMERVSQPGGENRYLRRLIIFLNVAMNVGMLAYFKYFNLLIDTLTKFTSLQIEVADLILPAGISFFTFRSISYITDIYRGDLKPTYNLLDYTFFLTFFPPLLAGPVVRAKDMLPQIRSNATATAEMVSEGFYLIILGLIKKVVIADFISGNFVDRVFDNPALYSGFENMMATFGFTIQLYCDFSGYSDMAIGIALLLGYRFKDNFNSPFKSQNPTEFWHRWHISLSTWLRDYVYIPLGGNRCSRSRAYFNQFATMVIGGLWHGASWMYVIWGAVHGVLLVLHKMFRRLLLSITGQAVVTDGGEMIVVATEPEKPSMWLRWINMTVTFVLISDTFIFFRAPSMEDVAMMWHQMIYDFHLSVAPQFVDSYFTIVLLIVGAYLIHISPSSWGERLKIMYQNAPVVIQGIILALVIILVIQVRQSEIVPFIYLQY